MSTAAEQEHQGLQSRHAHHRRCAALRLRPILPCHRAIAPERAELDPALQLCGRCSHHDHAEAQGADDRRTAYLRGRGAILRCEHRHPRGHVGASGD
eukprot:575812-Hanusia_phi.AAC.2